MYTHNLKLLNETLQQQSYNFEKMNKWHKELNIEDIIFQERVEND